MTEKTVTLKFSPEQLKEVEKTFGKEVAEKLISVKIDQSLGEKLSAHPVLN